MASLRTDGSASPSSTSLHLPNVVKVLIGVGLLIAINELVPEVVPAMLLLVALYLVLSRSDVVDALLGGVSGSIGRVYRPGGTS